MKDKELSRRQMRWVQKLADFNFRIMYQSDKQNIKIDALTCWVDVVLKDSEDERVHYQWITILTLNQMMTSSCWLLTQWNSCSSMFMFHEMSAFSASTEALMSRSETLLLTMLLSRRVVQDSTDSTLHVMMRDGRSCWGRCFLMSENSKNFLWISDNNWMLYSKNFLRIEWWKWV